MAASAAQYEGLPLIGAVHLEVDGGTRTLHISDTYDKDARNGGTLYAAASNDLEMPVVFLFVVDLEREGLLLQAVENRAGGGRGKTDGMFLAVHNALPDDALFPGHVRAIVHPDREKAAVWTFAEADGKKVLQVKANCDGSGEDTLGCFLTVPPDGGRDHDSSYVAVTPDAGAAVSVAAVPLSLERDY